MHGIDINIYHACAFLSYTFAAIVDGVQNNDAFKHTQQDKLNETWTALMKDLKVWEDVDDHMMYLRRRWVLGSSEWMSGMYGSKQNDTENLGYTDDEWAFIWATMIEDKAWAVPHIKDDAGHFLKHNDAPEILIKYIAHDLRCHIIVFDLSLDRIQFCSGNHLKTDNVIFDSPLLLYNTGGHFQSVFQTDHEFFIDFAKQLARDQNSLTSSPPSKKQKIAHPNKQLSPKGLEEENQVELEDLKLIRPKDRTDNQKIRYKFLMSERAKMKDRLRKATEPEKAKTRARLATEQEKAKTGKRLTTDKEKANTRARLATEKEKKKTRERMATKEQKINTRDRNRQRLSEMTEN